MENDNGEAETSGLSRACGRVTESDAMSHREAALSVERSICSVIRARPGLVESLVDVIAAGLRAEKWTYDLVQKARIYEPDLKERREMAKLAMAYLEGLPVQTVVGASVGGAGDLPRLAEVLKRSPNARRVLEGFVSRLGPVVEGEAGEAPSPPGA